MNAIRLQLEDKTIDKIRFCDYLFTICTGIALIRLYPTVNQNLFLEICFYVSGDTKEVPTLSAKTLLVFIKLNLLFFEAEQSGKYLSRFF